MPHKIQKTDLLQKCAQQDFVKQLTVELHLNAWLIDKS